MVRAIPSALSFAQDGLDNCTLEILREFLKILVSGSHTQVFI